MEKLYWCRVAISSGTISSCPFHRIFDKMLSIRAQITVLVYYSYSYKWQVLTICLDFVTVGYQFDMVGLAGSVNFLFGNSFSFVIISHYFYCSRFILRIHPHQAITLLAFKVGCRCWISTIFRSNAQVFSTLTLTLTVDKHFCRRIVGIDKNRSNFSFPSRPCPMRKDMKSLFILIPMAAVEIVTVFRQTGKVNDAK